MNHIVATIIAIGVAILACMVNSHTLHWFLLPVLFCGVILGADAVVWLRGHMDTFDLKGIIGLFGFHFFFLSPILFISGKLTPVYAELPEDWRYWIGMMGLVNAVSILFYKFFSYWGYSGRKTFKTHWQFNAGRTLPVLLLAIAVAFFAQIYVLFRFGGLAGIAAAQFGGDATIFAGAGIPRMAANSAPLLCVFGFFLLMRHDFRRKRSLLIGLTLVTLFSIIQFTLSGLYSTRGLVVVSIVWVVILLHHFWRPVSAKMLLGMLLPVLVLGWLYSFYKDLGPGVVDYLREENALERLEQKTGRTFVGTLIGDLSRTDVQAYMLFRLVSAPEAYNLRYGWTYLADFTPVIPFWIWPDKPANSGKVLAGTELLWGKGFYKPGVSYYRSNRAYGLGGEVMLNFGPYAAPLAYALWGFVVGRFRRYARSLAPMDLRWLVLPYMIWFIPNMLAWDLDNWVAHTINRALFPMIVVWLLACKVRLQYDTLSQGREFLARMPFMRYAARETQIRQSIRGFVGKRI